MCEDINEVTSWHCFRSRETADDIIPRNTRVSLISTPVSLTSTLVSLNSILVAYISLRLLPLSLYTEVRIYSQKFRIFDSWSSVAWWV